MNHQHCYNYKLKLTFQLFGRMSAFILSVFFASAVHGQSQTVSYTIGQFDTPSGHTLELVYDQNAIKKAKINQDQFREMINKAHGKKSKPLSQKALVRKIQAQCLLNNNPFFSDFKGEFIEEYAGDNFGFMLATAQPFSDAMKNDPAAVETQISQSVLDPYNYMMITWAIFVQMGVENFARIKHWLPSEICNFHLAKLRPGTTITVRDHKIIKSMGGDPNARRGKGKKIYVTHAMVNNAQRQSVLANRLEALRQRAQKQFYFQGWGMAIGASTGQILVDAMKDKNIWNCVGAIKTVSHIVTGKTRDDEEREIRRKACLAAHTTWTSPHKTAQLMSSFVSQAMLGPKIYWAVNQLISKKDKIGKCFATAPGVGLNFINNAIGGFLTSPAFTNVFGKAKFSPSGCDKLMRRLSPDGKTIRVSLRNVNSLLPANSKYFGLQLTGAINIGKAVAQKTQPLVRKIKTTASGIATGFMKNPWTGRIATEMVFTFAFFTVTSATTPFFENFIIPSFREVSQDGGLGIKGMLPSLHEQISAIDDLDLPEDSPDFGRSLRAEALHQGRADSVQQVYEFFGQGKVNSSNTFERRILRYNDWQNSWRDQVLKNVQEIYTNYREAYEATIQKWSGAKVFYSSLLHAGENIEKAPLPDDFSFFDEDAKTNNCDSKDMTKKQKFYCSARERVLVISKNYELLVVMLKALSEQAQNTKEYFTEAIKINNMIARGQLTNEAGEPFYDPEINTVLANKIIQTLSAIQNSMCYFRWKPDDKATDPTYAQSKNSLCGGLNLATQADVKIIRNKYPLVLRYVKETALKLTKTGSPEYTVDDYNFHMLWSLIHALAYTMNKAHRDHSDNRYLSMSAPDSFLIKSMLGVSVGDSEENGNAADPEAVALAELLTGMMNNPSLYPKTYSDIFFTANPYYKLIQIFGYPFRLRAPFYLSDSMLIAANRDWLNDSLFLKDTDTSALAKPWNEITNLYDYYLTSMACGTKLNWDGPSLSDKKIEKKRKDLMDENYIDVGFMKIGGGKRGFIPPRMVDPRLNSWSELCSSSGFFSSNKTSPKKGFWGDVSDIIGELTGVTGVLELIDGTLNNPFTPPMDTVYKTARWGENLGPEEYIDQFVGIDQTLYLSPVIKSRTLIKERKLLGGTNLYFDISDMILKNLPEYLVRNPEQFEAVWADVISEPIMNHLDEKNKTFLGILRKKFNSEDPIWREKDSVANIDSSIDKATNLNTPHLQNGDISDDFRTHPVGIYFVTHQETHNLTIYLRQLFEKISARQKQSTIHNTGTDWSISTKPTRMSNATCLELQSGKLSSSLNNILELLIRNQFCLIEEQTKFLDKPSINDSAQNKAQFEDLVFSNLKFAINNFVDQQSSNENLFKNVFAMVRNIDEYKNDDAVLTGLLDTYKDLMKSSDKVLAALEKPNIPLRLISDPRRDYYSMAQIGISFKMSKNILLLKALFDLAIDNMTVGATAKAMYRSMAYSLIQGITKSFIDLQERDAMFKAIYREKRSLETEQGLDRDLVLPWEENDNDDAIRKTFTVMYGFMLQVDNLMKNAITQGLYDKCEDLELRAAFYKHDLEPMLTKRVCALKKQNPPNE